jgi:alkanesulfonate monooxygenase
MIRTPIEPIPSEDSGIWFTAARSDDPALQARIEALSGGRLPTLEELQIAPLMYAGMTSWSTVDLVGARIATDLVGSAEQVAAKLRELQSTLRLDTFILSGWPLIREAEYAADLLLALLDLDHEPPVLAASPAEPQLVTA